MTRLQDQAEPDRASASEPGGDGGGALAPAGAQPPGLYEERDFLRASLEDLERERAAGDIDDADYHALHDDYVARTAAVLRAIEARQAVPRPGPRPRRGGWPLRLAVIAGIVAFGVGAGLLVARLAGTRTTDGALTGGIRASTSQELQRCLELASAALRGEGEPGSNTLLTAVRCYSEVLDRQPSNAEALAYRGWLLVRTGSAELAAAGQRDLDAAVAADPAYPDARAFRAVVFLRNGDAPRAKAELDALDAIGPPPIIDQILEQFGVRAGVEEALRNAAPASGDDTTTTTASSQG